MINVIIITSIKQKFRIFGEVGGKEIEIAWNRRRVSCVRGNTQFSVSAL